MPSTHGDHRLVSVDVDDMGDFGFGVMGWDNHGRVRERAAFGAVAEVLAWLREQTAHPKVVVRSDSRIVEALEGAGMTVEQVRGGRRVMVTLVAGRLYAEAGSRATDSPSWQGSQDDLDGLTHFLGACGGAVTQVLLFGNEPDAGVVAGQLAGWTVKTVSLERSQSWAWVQADGDGISLAFHWHNHKERVNYPADEVGDAVAWLQARRPGRVTLHGATPVMHLLAAELPGAGIAADGPRPEAPRFDGDPGGAADGFRVTLAVKGTGWMEARLVLPDTTKANYNWSYLTKPWRDTVTGLTRALNGDSVAIVWCDEPGSHQLVIYPRSDGTCRVEIRFLYNGLFGEPEHLDAGEVEFGWETRTVSIAAAFLDAGRLLLAAGSPADFTAAGIDVPPSAAFAALQDAVTAAASTGHGRSDKRSRGE